VRWRRVNQNDGKASINRVSVPYQTLLACRLVAGDGVTLYPLRRTDRIYAARRGWNRVK
jgi:hypothetical protein